ncbi:MAG: signal peptidase I [bacterium]|nr:signal peptidase I [bacterium]
MEDNNTKTPSNLTQPPPQSQPAPTAPETNAQAAGNAQTAQAAPSTTKTVSQPLGPTSNQDTIVGDPNAKNKAAAGGITGIIATIGIFLLAPLVAVFLTAFVFQSYEVDGPSMETTLQNQDRLVVYKFPKTWANIFGNEFIPDRGDIVIFTRDEGFGQTRQLIKRVIGVPGDHVVIENGKVTVYNDANPQGYDPDEGQAYVQPNGTQNNVDVTVGDDEVFVLGDNRSNSLDSRIFGPIKQNELTGKLLLRIYPLNKFDSY